MSEFFDSSFWSSGYPIALGALIFWWLGSKFFRGEK